MVTPTPTSDEDLDRGDRRGKVLTGVAIVLAIALGGLGWYLGQSATNEANDAATAKAQTYSLAQLVAAACASDEIGTENVKLCARAETITKQGPAGAAGPPGDQGAQGATGASGDRGPTGLAGRIGPIGKTGLVGKNSTLAGPTGTNGTDGVDGAMGPAGPAGTAGTDGATGPMGPVGPVGADGRTPTAMTCDKNAGSAEGWNCVVTAWQAPALVSAP